jgi:hypothetical protein
MLLAAISEHEEQYRKTEQSAAIELLETTQETTEATKIGNTLTNTPAWSLITDKRFLHTLGGGGSMP